MITTRYSLAGGFGALVALLAALEATAGMGLSAWVAGLACGALVHTAVTRGLASAGASALGPADLVTLIRATLTCAVAAMVADSFFHQSSGPTLVSLAVIALLLDAVDGRVARRSGTCSAFGARFDGEVDALLILVLSVYVAPSIGTWVLAIGAARYIFGVGGWGMPWLSAQLPPRYWRKVVAAVQGVVLAWAAAGIAPDGVVALGLAVALALLTESFGRDVLWLWSHRHAVREETVTFTGATVPMPWATP